MHHGPGSFEREPTNSRAVAPFVMCMFKLSKFEGKPAAERRMAFDWKWSRSAAANVCRHRGRACVRGEQEAHQQLHGLNINLGWIIRAGVIAGHRRCQLTSTVL